MYLKTLAPLLNRLLTLTYAIIVGFTVLVYLSPGIPPADLWISAFLPYSIPFLVLMHIFVAVYFILAQKWLSSIISGVLIVIGITFLHRIVALNFHQNSEKGKADFSILSYNVRVFNVYDIYNKNNPEYSKSIIRDAQRLEGDIKCFQEFYSDETSKTYNTIKRMSATHPYYYFEPFHINHNGGSFGMAIFSKYPIEKKAAIRFKEKSNNQILYTDIAIGRNIVRIFNVHLQSMHIDEEALVNAADEKYFKQYLLKALMNYRRGAISRSKQVDRLLQEINRSPYPVFVCGDFNEPPLSYAYKQVSKSLYNSHEKAGNGFGVTHNGKIPFLRIDNQFYQKDMNIHSFDVLNHKKHSDHFPLLGYYSFK